MAAADARQKLGIPSDKGEEQDFFSFSDKNTAQVYYDHDKKVYAISVNYLGGDNIPTPQSVVGSEARPSRTGRFSNASLTRRRAIGLLIPHLCMVMR